MKDVLEDPEYWRPAPRSGLFITLAVDLGLAIMAAALVAVLVIAYRFSEEGNDHRLKMEQTCLKASGQWIKGDCINNFIQLHG